MSQISVVQYNKLNVLQQNNISNKPNDRQIIVLRKPQHILPQPKEFDKDDILLTNTARKKSSGKSSKESKTNAAPVAVARRNARERNRVKQVNNGFANLRQHIPNFIAAAFENSNGRGGNKKLSKVETLRMAVEYIRSLEDILAMDNPEGTTSSSIPTNNITYTYQILSPTEEDDDLSSNTTASPQQFIKIDTSSGAFQVLSNTIYEDGENLDPMVVDEHLLTDPSLLDPNLHFNVNTQDLSYLQNVHSTDSLSPGFYSENSLSPDSLEKSDPNCFIPVFNTPPDEGLDDVKPNINDIPVISLKTENELPDEQKENMVDVLQWWEHQQPQNPTS
ncbi:unnamed protein product [Phyllotreta striolata]|uniref:BHLH domain-containing protein n=1 Tax=Phyllotreta striolata TaxID=444603 RepID=A0A9P0GXH4_PHYSR|nr:unnamed protein product [Phyllotreta striolata]